MEGAPQFPHPAGGGGLNLPIFRTFLPFGVFWGTG